MEGNVEGNEHEEGMEAVDLVGGGGLRTWHGRVVLKPNWYIVAGLFYFT